MAGYPVDQAVLSTKAAEAVLAMRNAFRKVEVFAGWLSDNPAPGPDPLTTQYGFSVDEAYVIRLYFETMLSVKNENQVTLDIGRKLTGLE